MEQRSRGIAAWIRPIGFNCNSPRLSGNTIRTTLAIDEDLLGFATSMAVARGAPIGRVVSDLMRLGMESGGTLGAEVGAASEGVRARKSH